VAAVVTAAVALWALLLSAAASLSLLALAGLVVLADRRWQSRAEREHARRFVEQARRRRK
jgi:hypothetical protein